MYREAESVSVILTSNFDIIRSFFLKDEVFLKSVNAKTLLNAASKDKDTKVFSNLGIDNKVVGVRHSLLRGKNGDSQGLIVLELYDYNSLFDLEFLTFNVTDAVKDSILAEKNFVKNSLDELAKREKERVGSYISSDVDREQLKERLSKGKDRFKNFLTEATLSNTPKGNEGYYISYGVGEDLKAWSGPFRCELAASKVEVIGSDARRITLEFLPSRSPYGLGMGTGQEDILINTYSHRFTAFSKVDISEEEIREPSNYDYSTTLHDLIKKYLTAIYANKANIIVLIPEIKTTLEGTIKKIVRKHKVKTADTIYRRNQEITRGYRIFSDIFKLFGIQLTNTFTLNPQALSVFVHGRDEKNFKFSVQMTSERESIKDQPSAYFKIPLDMVEIGFEGKERFRLIEETNVKALRLWKKYGFISDETKPTVVFGAESLISKLLYGEYFDEVETEEQLKLVNVLQGENSTSIFDGLNDPPQIKPDKVNSFRDFTYKIYETLVDNFISKDSLLENVVIDKDTLNTIRGRLTTIEATKRIKLEATQGDRSFTYYLRPDDRKYKDINYQKDIVGNLLKNIPFQYNEDQETDIPFFDEVLRGQKKKKADIRSFIPVFRSNVKNSNVLEYSFNFNKSNTAVLQTTLSRLVLDYAAGTADEVYDFNRDHQHPEDLNKHIHQLASRISNANIQDKILSLLQDGKNIGEISSSNNKVIAEVYTKLIAILSTMDHEKRPVFQISDYSGISEILVMYNILKETLRYTLSLRVKTLPMFYLSNYSDVSRRPVLFLAYAQQPVGIVTGRHKLLDTYISDFYTLVGFSHIITPSECYSEFVLAMPGSMGDLVQSSDPQGKNYLLQENFPE